MPNKRLVRQAEHQVMNQRRPWIGTLLIAGILLDSPYGLADMWPAPEPTSYDSKDSRFLFRTVPRQLRGPLAYFEDKTKGKIPAGQRPRGYPQCVGTLKRRIKSRPMRYRTLWSRPLVNDVAPVSALISNDGRYVATFDNWHSLGYGRDAIVLYGPGGKLISKLSLLDFLLPSEIDSLWVFKSASSINWFRGAHFEFDGGKSVLGLEVKQHDPEAPKEDLPNIPIWTITVFVDAATGRPKRPPAELVALKEQQAQCKAFSTSSSIPLGEQSMNARERKWMQCTAEKSRIWCHLCFNLEI